MTAYQILKSEEESWTEVRILEARSAKDAIRKYLTGSEDDAGSYVAVPARSWKPVTVKVETKTALTFS